MSIQTVAEPKVAFTVLKTWPVAPVQPAAQLLKPEKVTYAILLSLGSTAICVIERVGSADVVMLVHVVPPSVVTSISPPSEPV